MSGDKGCKWYIGEDRLCRYERVFHLSREDGRVAISKEEIEKRVAVETLCLRQGQTIYDFLLQSVCHILSIYGMDIEEGKG